MATFQTVFVLLLFYYNSEFTVSACDSFKNVTVKRRLINKNYFGNVVLSGCIDRVNLGDKLPVEIILENQYIEKLGHDAFRNMVKLEIVRVDNCSVQSLHALAFRNTPRLTEVYIDNNNFPEVPKDTFNRDTIVEILQLNNNGIYLVNGFQDMKRLVKLKMRQNKIKTIQSEWFINCTSLRILDFTHNLIEELSSKTFHHIRRIKQLHLNENRIHKIGAKTFERLTELQTLNLQHNRLKVISVDWFGTSDLNLKELALSANKLNYIGVEVMQKLRLQELKIDGNPINCSCRDELAALAAQLSNGTGKLVTSDGCDHLERLPTCVFPRTSSIGCAPVVDHQANKQYFDLASKVLDRDHRSCVNLEFLDKNK